MSSSTRSIVQKWPGQARWGLAIIILGVILFLITGAETSPFGTTLVKAQDVGFSKTFIPNIIGPGSVTTLSFTINNTDPAPLTNLAFTDVLTPGLVIATPANATVTCDATLVAPDGGNTISFSADRLEANSVCVVTVDVTSSTPGIHQNVSGQLTSDAGEHGNALADLTVDVNRPGFSKRFSPDSILPGDVSTLIFTIDNTLNQEAESLMTFTDFLPLGMVVANPSNASTDCGSAFLAADPETSLVNFSYGSVSGLSSCNVSVDVTVGDFGTYVNSSGELAGSGWTSGRATAVLDASRKFLLKSFTDDPVPPGGDVTLEFTVTNLNRSDTATDITFSDDLDATLAGLEATGLPLAAPCGVGSQLVGTRTLALNGGELLPEASCTFSVTLQVPVTASPGVYVNTTSVITAQVGDDIAVYDPATDRLFVWPAPLLTKSFDDPVAAGGTVTLTFTLTNTSPLSSVTDIAFMDEHTTIFPYGTSVGLPSPGFCGDSSVISIVSPGTERQALSVTGGSLGPGASCTFDVTFQVPTNMVGGTYHNTTSPVTALLGDMPIVGRPATDDLVVVVAPTLRKSFDDPVIPGGTVALEFSLIHDAFAPADATAIAFTDNLAAVMTGLTATGLPASDVCGAGSLISGDTNLSFTGGSLAPGETCVFSVTLQVPADAVSGIYPNTTSNVTADVSGLVTTGYFAQDDLDIGGLVLSKSFTDDPAIPGDTVTLQFTIVNSSAVHAATAITFTDNLNDVINGLSATDLPKTDVCGAGSQILGTSDLDFTGGSLDPGTSCTFTTTLQVPPGTASDTYINATSDFQATIAGGTVHLVNATGELVVSSDMLWLTKSFAGDPVMPGDALTLTFTLTNLHATQSVTGIAFGDDLDAVLPGLAAVGLPAHDVCGAGSQISGTSQLDFTGGTLGPGASCAFDVMLQVPQDAAPGVYDNTTSDAAGAISGLAVRGDPARDDFLVSALAFSKSFDGPSVAGGNPVLTFDIHNPSTDTQAVGISFLDNLEAVLPGLKTTGLPVSDVCGPGSLLTGLSFLTLSGGSLEPEASCTFSVTLQVPVTASPGTYRNTTDDLTLNGLPVSDPAVATLTIEPPPGFDKGFAPDAILAGEISVLTFSIDNTASALAASDLDFTDTLPSGVVLADPPNASTTCDGGALTAVAGAGSVGYSGGTVGAGASCTVQVDVTSVVGGEHVNVTGDLTSSSGDSGPASATLTVTALADLAILKRDSTDPIAAGATLTYTLVVSNNGPSEASGVVITDTLPDAFTFSDSTCGDLGTLTLLIWNVGALPPGGSYACTISGVVDAGFSGLLTNVAAVTSAVLDPQPDNNTVAETTQVYQPAAIGDYVWYDADQNGIQDEGEMGVLDVIVNLRDGANTTQLGSTTTDASGFYSFTHLAPGDYLVEFVLPTDFVFAPQDQGADDALDSDADPLTGQTIPTTLASGQNDLTWDAGMYLPPLVDVEKSVLWSEVLVNQVITYTIRVTNTGSAFLSPVMVTDTLDAGLTFIGASPAETSVDGQTISWADVTAGAGLAPGASVQVTLLALAADEGIYDNAVHVVGVYPGGTVTDADQVPVTVTSEQDFVYYLPLVIRRD
jgi:uncharacterized repeat protein (TIGR01451 family)